MCQVDPLLPIATVRYWATHFAYSKSHEPLPWVPYQLDNQFGQREPLPMRSSLHSGNRLFCALPRDKPESQFASEFRAAILILDICVATSAELVLHSEQTLASDGSDRQIRKPVQCRSPAGFLCGEVVSPARRADALATDGVRDRAIV